MSSGENPQRRGWRFRDSQMVTSATSLGPRPAQSTPRWVASAIVAKAGGNPLFIIEMARHLIDTHVQSDEVDLKLPETIRNPIARRLMRLSEATRKLLATRVRRRARLQRYRSSTGLEGVPEVAALDALDEAVAARSSRNTRDPRIAFRSRTR